jgi:hypothetical protein
MEEYGLAAEVAQAQGAAPYLRQLEVRSHVAGLNAMIGKGSACVA